MPFYQRIAFRLLMVTALVLFVILAGIALMVHFERVQSARLGNAEAQQKLEFTDRVLSMEDRLHAIFNYDYSYWDEMVDFVSRPLNEWGEVNLIPSLDVYQLSGVWVLDRNFKTVYAYTRPGLPGQPGSWNTDDWLKTLAVKPFQEFYLETGGGIYCLRSAPIQPSDDAERKQKAQGYLVSVRLLDETYLKNLSGLLKAECVFASPDRSSNSALFRTREKDILVTHAFLSHDGRPVGELQAVFPVVVARLSVESSRIRLTLFIVTALIIMVILALALRSWVSRPLHAISLALNVESETPVSGLRGNKSEFGQIAALLGRFLEQKSQLKREIEERTFLESQLEHMALHDALTGLPNRVLFMDRIYQSMEASDRKLCRTAILYLDLDKFKEVNDTLGHLAGDQILKSLAARLSDAMRTTDTVCRMGGDEYILIAGEIMDLETVERITARVLQCFQEPLEIGGEKIGVSVSIGISLYPDNGRTADELLKAADIAMYRAKSTGRNRYEYYHPEFGALVTERVVLEKRIRRGLENNEFLLHYQPQVEMATGGPVGAEALVRWRDPEKGMVPPNLFLPMAEETGLILPLGDIILETACREAVGWNGTPAADLGIAVNLSARQLFSRRIIDSVRETLEKTGIQPQRLELEITESMALDDEDKSRIILRELSDMGIRIAIDDFGTGYSSFGYLKHFHVDTLKIGQIFIRNILADAGDQAIYKAITRLAADLGVSRIVTEGVETAEQLAFIRESGNVVVQGYYYSRPLPDQDLREYLYRSLAGPDSI